MRVRRKKSSVEAPFLASEPSAPGTAQSLRRCVPTNQKSHAYIHIGQRAFMFMLIVLSMTILLLMRGSGAGHFGVESGEMSKATGLSGSSRAAIPADSLDT